MELKSIKVKKKVYYYLKKLKVHPRESFSDVIQILLDDKRPKPMTRHRHNAISTSKKINGGRAL